MNRIATLVLFATAVAGVQSVARAQGFTWPEKPKNLRVLPKDTTGEKLRPIMVGFSRALGVRCSYCHKGDDAQPLTTYDFASDEKPNKDRAREMLRMLADINTDLKKIQPSGDTRVNMWCGTCHRGRPRPTTLVEELGEKYRKEGVKPALELYADLRKRFLERGAYDFGEGSLNDFGYEVLGKNDFAGAIEIFKLNVQQFPNSGNVYDSLGEAYMKSGDNALAQQMYEKSLALDPKNNNAKAMLAKLKESKGPEPAK
jgi:tetratricopeptide (TPR) repeat protein